MADEKKLRNFTYENMVELIRTVYQGIKSDMTPSLTMTYHADNRTLTFTTSGAGVSIHYNADGKKLVFTY